ncbi:hypothetical protein BDZ97DRAFT_1788330 [Flammula alnicola]|nr:hypothetical protein BDZ97DRAFT_1788330 [Flammula alnicola]
MELLRPPPIAAVAHGDGGSGSSLDSDSQRDRDSARSYQRLADQLEDDDDEHRSDAASASQSQQQQRERNDADDDDAMTRVLDVSEVHVARIVPRVVSHRVRLRDGPEDEVLSSALFGATFRPPIPATLPVKNAAAGEDAWNVGADQPQSVKAVLVQILSEV